MMARQPISIIIAVTVAMAMVKRTTENPTVVPVHLSTREHKVHNIMLYPEKHSWCKSTQIKQIVSHVGCKSIEMENNVCVGACFSFSVPRTVPETPGDDQLHYCDSCQPSKVVWATVSLECPENPTQPTMDKMVELIENCSCHAYGDQQSRNSNEQYLEDVGDEPYQASSSSGERETDDSDGGGPAGAAVDRNIVDPSSEVAGLPQSGRSTDNNIPKFLELKDVKMLSRRKVGSSKELEWNDTSSLIEDGIFIRPINTTIRDSILKSPGHQLLLRQLEDGIIDDEDDDVVDDDQDE